MLEHPSLKGEFDRRSAWLWLIANAAWKDHRTRTRGGIVELKRGQVIGGLEFLAKTWGWSVKRVRTFLGELTDEGMIEKGQANNQYASIITICNYDKYQTREENEATERASEGQAKGKPKASEGQDSTKDTRVINITPPTPPAGGPTPLQALEAFELYNATALKCGLPQADKFTPDRKRKIIARLKDYGLDGWKQALANIERSSFLTGKNDRKWRATLEFLLQPSSFSKVHDGGYGNGRHAEQKSTELPIDRDRWERQQASVTAFLKSYAEEHSV